MAVLKCKMCGGALEINNNETVAICEYCGTQQTLPRLSDDRRANLYDRANHFRRNNEYDKAMAIYEQILDEDKTDAEAYWSLVLCRYGIEYVEDTATHKRIPTVNRAQFTSIFDDDNYRSALQYADVFQKGIYEEEAKTINEIQKGILMISQKEEPFDVFICYKETDNNGRRTPDSVLAQELYYQLIQENFKVFFSRITLEDKLGSAYEPYIFAALNSAKVMVVLGTKQEYFNAVWVKNEWSRYLTLIKSGAKKMLIPAYKDMDPYELPEEFSHLQAQDMSKLGFMQDLIRGIKKIAQVDKPAEPVVQVAATQGNTAPLIKRALLFLEDGDRASADEYCEKALDNDPECAEAYVIKLLIDLGLTAREQLGTYHQTFYENANYRKAVRFGDEALCAELNGYNENIKKRNEEARLNGIYTSAVKKMTSAKTEEAFLRAAEEFATIANYQDAGALAKQCRENAEDARKDAILSAGKAHMYKNMDVVHELRNAIAEFGKIPGWKDADKLVSLCVARIEEIKAEVEAERLERERLEEAARIEEEELAERKKKIEIIVASVVAACIALVILWCTVFSPMIRYNKAMKYLEDGNYVQAVEIFTDLGEYKDSMAKNRTAKYRWAEKCLSNRNYVEAVDLFQGLGAFEKVSETQYAWAGSLAERGYYEEAVNLYRNLGSYKDCTTICPTVILAYVDELVEENNWTKAETQVDFLAEYEAYADQANALYIQIADAYYAAGQYDEMIVVYRKTKEYTENPEQYQDKAYQYAQSLLEQKEYEEAKEIFQKLSGYSDADNKILECDYQLAFVRRSEGDYTNAINLFTALGDYRDSETQIPETKYLYVKANQDRTNEITHIYLKELKEAKYKDSADIFEGLYKWSVELVAANTKADDGTTLVSTVGKSPSYFHYSIRFHGGEPGEKANFYHSTKFPGGSFEDADWVWDDIKDGYTAGAQWSNGFTSSQSGTLVVKIYNKDTGELVGTLNVVEIQ